MTYEQWLAGQTAGVEETPAPIHHHEDERRSLPSSRRCICSATFYGSHAEQRLDLAAHCWTFNAGNADPITYAMDAGLLDALKNAPAR